MIFGKSLVLFFNLFQKDCKILRFHKHNRSSHKLQDINIFYKLRCHFESNFEGSWPLSLLFQFFVWNYLLAVPSKPWDHFLNLRGSFVELFYLIFDFVFEFTPVWFTILANSHSVFTYNVEEHFLLVISPAFFVFFTFGLIFKINLSLILLNFNYSVNKFLKSTSKIICNWKILISLCLLELVEAIFFCIAYGNIVSVAVLVDTKQKIDIVLFSPPNSWSLTEKQAQWDKIEKTIPIDFSSIWLSHVFKRIFTIFMNKIFDSIKKL